MAVRLAIPLLLTLAPLAALVGWVGAGCNGGGSGDFTFTPIDASLLMPASKLACTSAAECLPGQVCCSRSTSGPFPGPTEVVSSDCERGPCQQLCRSSAECLDPGTVCGTSVQTPKGATMICVLSDDSGTAPIDGGEAGNSADAPSEAPADGGSPGRSD